MPVNPVDQGTQLMGRGSEYLERLNLDQVSEPLGGGKQGKVDDKGDKALTGSLIKGGGGAFGQRSFGDVLGGALNNINQIQTEANRQAELLATGQTESPHDAMIAMEKAHLALQLTANVVEKAVGAYKQISQMQI
jgi:flagellar hook-basal body complex protein FliE